MCSDILSELNDLKEEQVVTESPYNTGPYK